MNIRFRGLPEKANYFRITGRVVLRLSGKMRFGRDPKNKRTSNIPEI
jgi:hypothetical protein